jgi:hypothetical protein
MTVLTRIRSLFAAPIEERRRETRTPSSRTPVLVLWGFNGEDISRSGLGLALDHQIPLEAKLRIQVGDAVIFGHLCHCRPHHANEKFFVGVRIDSRR